MNDLDGRCFLKRDNHLIAADFAAEEFLAGIPNGREVVVTVRRARSPKHHRWFFALLHKVVANSEHWVDEEDLLDDLKLATGHAERRVNILTGETYRVAKSINFASMAEDPFRRFKERCLYVLAKALGIDPDVLMEETDATQRIIESKASSIIPAEHQEGVWTGGPGTDVKASSPACTLWEAKT